MQNDDAVKMLIPQYNPDFFCQKKIMLHEISIIKLMNGLKIFKKADNNVTKM